MQCDLDGCMKKGCDTDDHIQQIQKTIKENEREMESLNFT